MDVLQNSTNSGTLPLAMVVLLAGTGLLAALAPASGGFDVSASAQAQCLDAADVLAAQDRSRNGVSLTCNQAMVARESVR